MKALKIELLSEFGFLRHPFSRGFAKEKAPIPFVSTIQGILSRMNGETLYLDDILPLGYRFSYKNTMMPQYEVMTMVNLAPDKKNKRNAGHRDLYVRPRLEIYLPGWKDVKVVNQPYLFSREFPADCTVSKVKLKHFSLDDKIKAGGVLLDEPYPMSNVIYAPLEFEYDTPERRSVKKYGIHYYYPVGDSVVNTSVFEDKWENKFVEEGRLVVILDEDDIRRLTL